MQPARLFGQSLGLQSFSDGRREGDDVVLDLGFDLLDARNGESGLL